MSTGREGPDAALDLLRSWDAQNDAESDAAAYANVLWDELVQDLFVRGREAPGAGRRTGPALPRRREPPARIRGSPWWTNAELGVSGQQEMLEYAASAAYDRLVELQGDNPSKWNWGSLHALPLVSDTFGSSGIAPIEVLFNRGPVPGRRRIVGRRTRRDGTSA